MAEAGDQAPQPIPRTGQDGDAPLPSRWPVFAVVSVALLMASVDRTIVATALPTVQHELHADLAWSSWTITVYSLGQVLMMPLAGTISDQFGRKRIFLTAVVLFTAASLACGLAKNVPTLVALRAVQALGGGAIMPSATGIVADQFRGDRERAVGLFSSILPVGAIIGPVAGGVLVTYWSWRGIFLINVPLGVLLLAVGSRLIPAGQGRAHQRVDLLGAGLLTVSLLAGMCGLAMLGDGNISTTDPRFLAFELLAIVTGAWFVRHTHRGPAVFIPAKLLYGKGFRSINLINLVYGAAALGFATLVPLYAEQRYRLPPLAAGSLLTARAVGMIATAGLAVLALRRFGYRLPIAVGFSTLIGGLILTALPPPIPSAYTWLAVSAGITGVGMGVALPAANNAALRLAPDRVAVIAGLRGTFRQTGSIAAIAVTTALMARSANPGLTQASAFTVCAVLLAATLPLLRTIPERHGSW